MARTGGLAAITGGALRVADSFTAGLLPQETLNALYLATDLLLLFAIGGIWLARRATLGLAGHIGIAVFVGGILMVRAAAFGFGSYALGASIAALGIAVYAVETLLQRSAGATAPVLWLAALGFGVAGTAGIAPPAMMVAAGVAFGLGFVVAGIELLRAQSSLAVR